MLTLIFQRLVITSIGALMKDFTAYATSGCSKIELQVVKKDEKMSVLVLLLQLAWCRLR
jgi:hypothetical protein